MLKLQEKCGIVALRYQLQIYQTYEEPHLINVTQFITPKTILSESSSFELRWYHKNGILWYLHISSSSFLYMFLMINHILCDKFLNCKVIFLEISYLEL